MTRRVCQLASLCCRIFTQWLRLSLHGSNEACSKTGCTRSILLQCCCHGLAWLYTLRSPIWNKATVCMLHLP